MIKLMRYFGAGVRRGVVVWVSIKNIGVLCAVIGAALTFLAVAYPWSYNESKPFIESSYERANLVKHGDIEPPGQLAYFEQQAQRERREKSALFKAKLSLNAGMIFLALGGICILVSVTRALFVARKNAPPAHADTSHPHEAHSMPGEHPGSAASHHESPHVVEHGIAEISHPGSTPRTAITQTVITESLSPPQDHDHPRE